MGWVPYRYIEYRRKGHAHTRTKSLTTTPFFSLSPLNRVHGAFQSNTTTYHKRQTNRKRVVLHHMNFKGKVVDCKFSPCGRSFAVCVGKLIQIWATPTMLKEFAPFRQEGPWSIHTTRFLLYLRLHLGEHVLLIGDERRKNRRVKAAFLTI